METKTADFKKMATGFRQSIEWGQDAVYEHCCTPCADDKLNAEAFFYCRNCSKLFCVACVRYHDKFIKGHQVLGKEDKDKWGDAKAITPAVMCEKHPDKEEDMFCADHDLTCCHICINSYHRACTEVRHLSEVAMGIQKTPEFQSFLTNAARTQTSLRNLLDKKAKNTKLLQKTRNKIMSSFKHIRQSFNQFMDKIEKESTTEVDRLLSILQTKLQFITDECSEFENEIEKFLDDIKQYGNKSNELAFLCFKKCMRKLSSAEQLISSMEDGDYQLEFSPDSSIRKFQSSLKLFGKFYITQMILPPDHVYKVDKIQTHNISTTTRECSIGGMCQLPEGQVGIVDWADKKVKLLRSSKLSVIHELDLGHYPRDICSTNGTELVVTVCSLLPYKTELYFINAAGRHLSHTGTKQLDHICYGIACHNGLLYVGSDNALYEYSLSGQKLRKIYEDTSISGFAVSRFSVSNDGTRIYITNNKKDCLVTVNKSGQPLSVIYDPELQKPRGVCVADNGTVFVCGVNSHTVIQVDSEGKKKIGTLAKQSDGVKNPLSLCYDKNFKQLLLGQEKNGNLLVLKLK